MTHYWYGNILQMCIEKNIPNTSIFGINKLHTLKQPLSLLLIQHNHSQFTDVVINYIQLFDK